MRPRITTKVDIASAIQQIDYEFNAYCNAIKTVMKLDNVKYKDAKAILDRRITERLLFKKA
jgi:hypothetical protein